MRAAPPFQFTLSRFGVWQAAVGALAALALAVMLAWLWARLEQAHPQGLLAAWACGLFAIVLLAGSLMRVGAVSLNWDGRQWMLSRVERTGQPAGRDATAGEIDVALDLGNWMLLRFRPVDAPASMRRAVWLPAQRRGLEGQWHALRCAVYSPRPAPARDAADHP